MIWAWLRRRLEVDGHSARLVEVSARLMLLEQWVRNIDTALGQHVDQDGARTPADYKALADKIRAQVMAAKQAFPTRADDVQG